MTSAVTHPTVTYRISDDIALLRLDDGKANAIGYETLAAIDDAIDDAESRARALVIIGREGRFSAGFDLEVISAGPSAARDLVKVGARTAMHLYGARVPVVSACNGHALAFGAIMLLASDLRIGASVQAKIGLNEVSIGMSLPIFAVELARDRLSRRHFTRATTLAAVYSPAEAVDAGYLDEVVAAETLEATALERAGFLADHLSMAGFAATRRNARGATIDHILGTLDEDLKNFLTAG